MQTIIFFLNNSVRFLRLNKTICTTRKAAKENYKQLLSSDESLLNKTLNNRSQAFLRESSFYWGRLGPKRSAFSLWWWREVNFASKAVLAQTGW